jgi:pimeloyl-ACP methyl ester carboxylesterase
MPYARNDDVEIYYEDEGTGLPVLLIHGHTLDRRVWDWIAPGLRQGGLRLIRPDLRGHGRSTRPDRGYHWSHHAADMTAVIDAVGVSRAVVVGYSIGGGVALEMAVTVPERVGPLLLLSPVLPDRAFEEAFFTNLREVARVVRSEGVAAAMMGPWMESPLWQGSLSDPAVRAKVTSIVRDFPGAEYLATERDHVARDWSVPDRLGEIEVPTLVMVGENELAGFQEFAEETAASIPNARLEVLAGLGHLHLLQAPDVVAQIILDHLGERFTS